MKTIISILSAQPIPNVLFIKELAMPEDNYIFISTKQMEAQHKSQILAAAVELKQSQFEVITVDAYNPTKIQQKLVNYNWDKKGEYAVNITGGTKMMSQMVYIHFAVFEKASIYYWPDTNTHLQQLFPKVIEQKIKRPIVLDLKTYFLAFDYDFLAASELTFPEIHCQKLFQKVISAGSAEKVQEISIAVSDQYKGENKVYYSGAWFEEWLYLFLKNTFNLSKEHIAFNVKLKNRFSIGKTESDNELDVAFIYKNRLYIWECKVYTSSGYVRGKKITDPIYKIASITQSLGLQAISFVAICSKLNKGNHQQADSLEDISRLMRIKKVFSMDDFSDLNQFQSTLFKLFNYGT